MKESNNAPPVFLALDRLLELGIHIVAKVLHRFTVFITILPVLFAHEGEEMQPAALGLLAKRPSQDTGLEPQQGREQDKDE